MNTQRRLTRVFILLLIALLSVSGSFAQGNSGNNGNNGNHGNSRITICHATGSASNPYNLITISINGLNGHNGHDGDIIPAPANGCPDGDVVVDTTPLNDRNITICHATGSASNPYNLITISINGLNGHNGHTGDIIPAPADGCPEIEILPPDPMSFCESALSAGNFPILNGNRCNSDTSVLEPPVWQALSIGATVCDNWLVYHTDQTGDWELFRLDVTPNNLNPNLSRGTGAADIAPSRSPDGEWIVFTSNRDGNWEIYISAVNRDDIRRVTYNTTAVERDPVWSPTGGQIVYESNRNGKWDLYLFDVNTGIEELFVWSDASDMNASWSPDGVSVIFQSERDGFWQIYEKNYPTDTVYVLSDGVGNDIAPQYSNDGTRIVFHSFRDGNNRAIYWMNADGSNLHQVSDSAGFALNYAISPQSDLIAYNSDLIGANDIYIYEFATEMTRQLTNTYENDYAPTWYCGEPTLIFTSDVMGNPDLFSASALPMDAPAILIPEEAVQLTNLLSRDIYPMMSPSEENASRLENFINAFAVSTSTLPTPSETAALATPVATTTPPNTSGSYVLTAPPLNEANSIAFIRFAHTSVDVGSLDIYMGSSNVLVVSNLLYGETTDAVPINGGELTFRARPHDSGANGDVLNALSWNFVGNSSWIVTAVGVVEKLAFTLEPISVTRNSYNDQARIRVVNLIAGGSRVTLTTDSGIVLGNGLGWIGIRDSMLAPGTYDLQLSNNTGVDLSLSEALSYGFQANTTYTLYIIGGGTPNQPISIINMVSEGDKTYVMFVNNTSEAFDLLFRPGNSRLIENFAVGTESSWLEMLSDSYTFITYAPDTGPTGQELAAISSHLRPARYMVFNITGNQITLIYEGLTPPGNM